MTYSLAPAAGAEQRVTASELVRQFGVWQERATRAPVYVLHRGRPRFALVALDLMEALCQPHATGGGVDESQRDALIDAIPDLLVVVDAGGRIVTASAAARARFGAVTRPGGTPAMLSQRSGAFLTDAVARVLAGGGEEEIDVTPDRFPDRALSCTVTPLPEGALIVLRDPTPAEQLRALAAAEAAHAEALALTGVCARVRVGLRGHLVEPGEPLAALTGVTREQLAQARLVTLIAIADRPRVGAAIEDAATGKASRVEAGLLVRGSEERRVSLGLSPVQVRGRVEEVAVAIAAATPA